MPSDAFDRLRALLGPELQQVAGASVSGEIPVNADVVNRLIGHQLDDGRGPFAAAHLELHDANQMIAHVTLRSPAFVPSLRVSLRIEQQPQFPGSPILGLRWRIAGMGLFAKVAGPALAFFRALPPGVRVQNDRLLLDVRRLMESRGLGDALRYVSALQISTQAGVFVVRFAVRVPEVASSGPDA